MFDRLGRFKSQSKSEIQNLVGPHYVFCQRPDTSAYFMDILYNDKYLYNDIKNLGNLGHD